MYSAGLVVAAFLLSTTVHAEPNIGNGTDTTGYAPVVHLMMPITETKGAQCTGTWISNRHILTAAHCTVYAEEASAPRGFGPPQVRTVKGFETYQVDGKTVKFKVYRNPKLTPEQIAGFALEIPPTTESMKHDQAIIEVQDGSATTKWIYPLSPAYQKIGTEVRMVGFGITQDYSKYSFDLFTMSYQMHVEEDWTLGKKRTGTNVIAGYEDDLVLVNGKLSTSYSAFGSGGGEPAVVMPGDSGGPLLALRTVNGQQKYFIVGVASAITPQGGGKLKCSYSSTNTPENAAWIKSVLSK